MAISSGACGGDLLFAESCLQRRLRVEIYLPFVEEEFLEESINFAGEYWREKFFWVKERARRVHIMPQELGPTPPPAKTPLLVSTCGCSIKRSLTKAEKSALSACGIAKRVTDQAGRSIYTTPLSRVQARPTCSI